MGLKLQKGAGIKRPLTIRDGFTVDVVHHTRVEREQFAEGLSGFGEDEVAQRCAEFFLAGGRGLTPATARKLAVPVADDQPVNDAGEIEVDMGVLADVWRHAYPARFSNMVIAFSEDMLAAIDREKEAAKNG